MKKTYVFLLLFIAVYSLSKAQQKKQELLFQVTTDEGLLFIDYSGKIQKGPYTVVTIYSSAMLVSEKGKLTLIDNNGNMLMDMGTDSLLDMHTTPQPMAVLIRNGKCGVAGLDKKWLIQPDYELLTGKYYNNGNYFYRNDTVDCFVAKKNSKYGLITIEGKQIIPCEYDKEPEYLGEDVIKLERDTKLFLFLMKSKTIIATEFEEINNFYERRSRFKQNGKYGFINKKCEQVIKPAVIKQPNDFYKGLSSIDDGKHTTYIDTNGKIIVPPLYDYVETTAIGIDVTKAGKHGYYSLNGKLIVPAVYESVSPQKIRNTNSYFYVVQQKKLYGAYDNSGRLVIPVIYSDLGNSIYKGRMVFERGGKQGIITTTGKEIIPPIYDEISEIDSTYFIFRNLNKYGMCFFNSPKKNIQAIYDTLLYVYTDSLFLARRNNKWGLINIKKPAAVNLVYDAIFLHQNEFAFVTTKPDDDEQLDKWYVLNSGLPEDALYVKLNGLWGVIDSKGKEIIPVKYDRIDDFITGYAIAKINNKYCVIDSLNNIIYPKEGNINDSLYHLIKNDFRIIRNGKTGIINKMGQIIVPPIFDFIGGFDDNGVAKVTIDGKEAFINRSGKYLISPVFPMLGTYTNKMAILNDFSVTVACVDSTGRKVWKYSKKEFYGQNVGRLDESICAQEDLESVNFIGNDWDYSFQLPFCFYNLKKLKRIIIENCDLDSIPPEIKNLQQLHYLSIGSYKLKNIPAEIGYLKELDTLMISYSCQLPGEISKLAKLRYLETGNKNLPVLPQLEYLAYRADSLPNTITGFKNLKTLSFYMSSVNEDGYSDSVKKESMKYSINQIGQLTSLETLVIAGDGYGLNNFIVENITTLSKLTKLKKLSLSYIADEDIEKIKKVFPDLIFQKEE